MIDVDISTEADTMTSKYKIYEEGRKTPHKYTIKFNRSELQGLLNNGDYSSLTPFFDNLESQVKAFHKNDIKNK
tara:strand:+ start:1250 stop:1471 length:222 start_codon:yes stop_codon:yes gene_type:complete